MNISSAITKNSSSDKGDYAMQFPTIQENTDLQQAVNAKDLYLALGLNIAHWARWSKQNIQDNPFALEGMDYGVYTSVVNTQGGRPTLNYMLSIDFAKKLAMQVRTEKGEKVRDYFLECERKASQPVMPALPDFTNPAEAARAWASEFEQKQIAQEQLALAAPKVAHYDAVADRKTLLNATQVAQSVGLKSAQALNKRLSQVGVYNGNCKRGKAFQAWFVQRGLGEMKQGNTGHMQPLFTTKGQIWVYELLSKEVA